MLCKNFAIHYYRDVMFVNSALHPILYTIILSLNLLIFSISLCIFKKAHACIVPSQQYSYLQLSQVSSIAIILL